MPITLKQSQLKYKNPETGTYVGVDAVAEKTTAEMVAEVESAGQAKISAINARATEVQASLPKVGEMEDIVAVPFVQSEPYPEGWYVIQTVDNVNQLYKLPEGHTAGVAWGEFTVIGPITFSEELNYTIKDLVAVQDEQPESSDNKIWMTETPPEPVVVPTYDEFEEIAERAGLSYDFMKDNDFDYSAGKENVLEVPYVLSNILTGSLIYADGSINNTGAAYDVSPLIPISEGTYGLKTSHNAYIGMINEGNNFKNGYGFFGADGHTIVTRPENLLHEVSTDIYVFDVPSGAKYVRFTYKSADGYRDDALAYFNQWILLPNANDDIDESFFILRSPKEDGETEKILRMDGTKIYLRDDRIGDLSELNTLHKTDIVSAINEGIGGVGEAGMWLEENGFDSARGKVNILDTPYALSDVLTNRLIYSDGTINEATTVIYDVSPLIPVSHGTYGLKTSHNEYIGHINQGNDYRNGYAFFGNNGETIVARPTNLMHEVSTDIYVFDVPSGAKYVRFSYKSADGYHDDALEYFNQWILLPNADDNIDASFFTLTQQKSDGEIEKILRNDGSEIYLRDDRVGDLANLNTSAKTDIVSAINEAVEGGGGNDAWLEANNLDATANGKVNVLSTPYVLSDIAAGKIIYSNGSLNDNANTDVSPLIPVSEGTYGLKIAHSEYTGVINSGNNYKNGYGFFGQDGETIVARPTNLMHQAATDIYVFDVPPTAKYVRFCYSSGEGYRDTALGYFNQWILLPNANDNIDGSFFTLSPKKQNGEINKIMRVDGSYVAIADEESRSRIDTLEALPITFGRRTCAIFEKVCCIGDSYTEGYIVDSSDVSHTNKAYSWVEHLKNMTGRDYVNLGIGGATSASWLTSERGLAKAQLPENKSQAYIIGLQINDAAQGLTVGTTADIGTNTQSYYGCTSKIIDEMFEINDYAHVFLLTQPKNFTGEHSPYRTAILNIVDWYQNANNGTHQNQVHLIDLLDYWQLFRNAGCVDAMYGGHYTPVGYEYVAEIMMYAWSNYINAHPLLFQDVNLIPFGADS